MAIEEDIVRAIIVGAVYAFRTKLERTLANTPIGRYELTKGGVDIFPMSSNFVRFAPGYMELSGRIIRAWESQ